MAMEAPLPGITPRAARAGRRPASSLAILLLGAAGTTLGAQAAPHAPDTLTGDWNGQRSALSARGIDFDMTTGATYQNIFSGGYTGDDGALGASALELHFDTARAGLWPGGELRARGEARYGEDVQADFGGFGAINVDSALPHDPDRVGHDAVALTELVYAHTLSPRVQLFAGLLNSDEGDDNPLAGNLRRRDRFLNTFLLTSAVRMRLSPQVAPGVGVRLLPLPQLSGEIRIYDGEEAAGQRLDELRQGSVVATEWTYDHQLLGHPGRQMLGFRYGFDRAYSAAGTEDPRLLAALAPALPATHSDTWAAYYNVAQSVVDWGDGRGWGVFGRLGYGDNDANPVDWNAALGAVATGLLATSAHDVAGLGYFHVYQMDGPVMRQFAYDDEQGLEAWYNAEIVPWLHVTADLQMIDSDIDRYHGTESTPVVLPGGLGASADGAGRLAGREASDISWVFGLRTEVSF